MWTEQTVSSWGRVIRAPHKVARPAFRDEIPGLVRSAADQNLQVLGRGLGRAYGDSPLNPGQALIDATGLDKLISFDETSGLLKAEAGTTLSELLRFLVPRGWFLPTVPGTRFVTLGGAIANDVHGKNHGHAGSIGCSVNEIELVRTGDPGGRRIGPETDPELFAATIGGLGLTGLITTAALTAVKIPSAYLAQTTIPFSHVNEFFDLSEENGKTHEFTVSWIDCTAGGPHLGRGFFQCSNWSEGGDYSPHTDSQRLRVPFDAPGFTLNPLTLKAFNSLYTAWNTMKAGTARVHYSSFFFPLDSIGNWNRMYGSKGFYQYQCVVPPGTARDAIREILGRIQASGDGSMLAVLKTFGSRKSPGMLSFPMPGATLALDFRNRGDRTIKLFETLDAIVSEAGGRLYPAKDGRIPAHMMQSGFPELDRFRAHVDGNMASAFWNRISK